MEYNPLRKSLMAYLTAIRMIKNQNKSPEEALEEVVQMYQVAEKLFRPKNKGSLETSASKT